MTRDETLRPEKPELTAHRRPLKALTGIRFFAAFYVVVFHSRLELVFRHAGVTAAANFVSNGYLAVQLFFLLSGFILSYTYAGQINMRHGYRRFWEARFARIWPLYTVSLFCTSIPSLRFPPPLHMLAALFMVQAWIPMDQQLAGVWNFVCWTLSAEAFFYLCFPLTQSWLERRSQRTKLVWTSVMLLACLAMNSAAQSLGTPSKGYLHYLPMGLIHLPEFLAGVGMGNYFLAWSRARGVRPATAPARNGIWTYFALAASLGLLCLGTGPWTSLILVSFLALIYGLASEQTLFADFLSTRIMILGGGLSYAMYLMQMPVKAWVAELMHRIGLDSDPLRLGCNLIVLILLSLILFKAVEEPARKVLRSFFANLEQRRLGRAERAVVS